MIAPASSSKPTNAKEGGFCKTEEIMRKIVPTSMKIDDKARQLIEKCVTEFACSITNIAAGYCSIDQPTLNPAFASVHKPNDAPGELKSEHIIRSLENMGFTEYSKPLSTYKQVQKSKVVPQQMKQLYLVDVNQAKKQKGMNGAAVVTNGSVAAAVPPAPRATLPVPPNVNGKVVVSRNNVTYAQTARQQQQDVVDQYLKVGTPAITIAELSRKVGVSHAFVSKRVQALRDSKVELKGLKVINQAVINNRVVASSGSGSFAPTGVPAAVLKPGVSAAIVSTVSQAVVPTGVIPTTAPIVNMAPLSVSVEPATLQNASVTGNVPV